MRSHFTSAIAPWMVVLISFSPLSLDAVEIIAHRGASHDAPENTVAAFVLGWQQQADAGELDLQLTKDRQIVVIHDAGCHWPCQCVSAGPCSPVSDGNALLLSTWPTVPASNKCAEICHECADHVSAAKTCDRIVVKPIRVDDVVTDSGDARRTLEIRFRQALGRSIHTEIQRTRLELARRLLLETDLPLPKVAQACGFGSPSYLAAVFHRNLGVTPIKYRANNRNR